MACSFRRPLLCSWSAWCLLLLLEAIIIDSTWWSASTSHLIPLNSQHKCAALPTIELTFIWWLPDEIGWACFSTCKLFSSQLLHLRCQQLPINDNFFFLSENWKSFDSPIFVVLSDIIWTTCTLNLDFTFTFCFLSFCFGGCCLHVCLFIFLFFFLRRKSNILNKLEITVFMSYM